MSSNGRRMTGIAVLVAVMVFTLLPLVSLLSAALQPQGSVPTGLAWPNDPQWGNFVDAWNAANMLTLLKSSTLIVIGVVPAALILSALAGYGLGQLRVPGATLILLLLLVGLTSPLEAKIIPLYYQLRDMGLLNTRWAIILPLIGLFMPFGVIWMRAHFLTIPRELTDAAKVDGATTWRAFRHIHIPLAMPALASLALLLFLWTWNQFLLAIVLVDDPSKRTMAGALGSFQGQYGTDVVLLSAGALVIMAPTVMVFLLLQRHFVRALLQGAIKG